MSERRSRSRLEGGMKGGGEWKPKGERGGRCVAVNFGDNLYNDDDDNDDGGGGGGTRGE